MSALRALLLGACLGALAGPARAEAPPDADAPIDAPAEAAPEAKGDAVAAAPTGTAAAAAAPAAPEAATRLLAEARGPSERWVRTRVPDELEREGPLGLEWWQWLALPLLALVSAALGRAGAVFTAAAFLRVARATPSEWDDALALRSRGPLTLAWAVGVAAAFLPLLFLAPAAVLQATTLIRAGLLLALLWLALRSVDIGAAAATQAAQQRANAGAASMVPLVARASKIGLAALGVVSILSSLGYPVGSLLAGLGIGGLAIALAAQKTAENVFGSISIGVDQPFRVGDLVQVDDIKGVVERIGLRSTRIRTADRTLVTLPNGRLSEMRVENFADRDRMRVQCTLSLELDTPTAAVRAVLAAVQARIAAQPLVVPEATEVRLVQLGAHALDIDVVAWFTVTEAVALAAIREELLLGFLEVVEASGARLAFPTRTVRLSRAE